MTAPQGSAPQSANVAVLVSDASSEDWATIGVKILSIALVPQGGGANVTVYTAPTPTPVTNLVMLDQLDELLGNTSIPVGTYTGAVLTVSGNAERHPAHHLLRSRGGLCGRREHHDSVEPDPGAAHARARERI